MIRHTLTACALAALSLTGHATVLTFEGSTLTGANRSLDNDGANAHGPSLIDYAGYDWTGMVVAKPNVAINRPQQITGFVNDPDDGLVRVTTPVDAGFHRAAVSGDTIAYTQSFNGSTSLFASIRARTGNFDFNSVYMTSGWRDDIDVLVTGLRDGAAVYTVHLTVGDDAPSLFSLGFTNIDEIQFLTSGGSFLYPNGSGVGSFVNPSNAFSTPTLAFDNMDISAAALTVPEPASYVLFGLALLAAGHATRRNRAG